MAHGGMFGGSSGIPKEKLVAVQISALPGGEGPMANYYKTYRVTPVDPLPAGEYFFVVRGYTLYDFGVDPKQN